MSSRIHRCAWLVVVGLPLLVLAVMAACTVSIQPGGDEGGISGTVTIANKTFVFRLSGTGEFDLRAGSAPIAKAGLVQPLFESPVDRPGSGVIALDPAVVTVVSLNTGKEQATYQGVTGTAELGMRVADAGAPDPCATGIPLGAFTLTLLAGEASLDRTALTLPEAALDFVLTGTFTVCLQMSADIDVRITIGEMAVQFGPVEDEPGHDSADDDTTDDGGGADDGGPIDDGSDDGGADEGGADDGGADDGGGDQGDDVSDGDDGTDGGSGGDESLFAASIEYAETITAIVRESDVKSWLPDRAHSIEGVAASIDGTKVAFLVSACGALSEDPDCWHLYAVNADGSNLVDLTPALPTDRAGMSALAVNDTGTRVFVRTPLFGTIHDVYFCELAGPSCASACLDINYSGGHKSYSINGAGTRMFFRHIAGWDPVAQKTQQGVYFADVGGIPQQIIHFDQLPPPGATLANMMDTLGCSADGQTVLFSWNHSYYSAPPQIGFWAVGPGGGAHQATPDLFRYVFPVQDAPHKIISADGATVLLYTMIGDENYLELVDMASGTRTTLEQYPGRAPFEYVSLSADAKFARYQAGGAYLAIMDIAARKVRDTMSYHTELSYHLWPPYVSDLVSGGRRFFLGTYLEAGAALHRVDAGANAASYATAPQITGVWFDAGSIPGDGSVGTTISVAVSDAQGAGDLEWVKIRYQVDGIEHPSWMSYDPLSIDTPFLFDDGTHGDAIAGDGRFSLNNLRANPGSNLYERFALPRNVGVRLVAKDREQNYTIVDASITVTAP